MNSRLVPLLGLLPLSILAGAGAVAAQEPVGPRFGEVLDVQLVNVEVWVTDRSGEPVKGLTVDDFVVLEDGKPVEVTYFAEVDGELPVSVDAARAPVAKAPSEARPALPPQPETEPNHLVIYFDQQHLKPSSRNQAVADLRDFLASGLVDPERVLILTQDRSLTTEATFGSTRAELDAALERVARSDAYGGRAEIDKRLALQRLQNGWERAQELVANAPGPGRNERACDIFVPESVRLIEEYAFESLDRIEITLDHLRSVASFLTGVQGVKTLLFLSDALERAPGSAYLTYVNGVCPAQSLQPGFLLGDELSTEFRDLTRHANANRVTIYAMQTSGLEGSFLGGAEQRSLDTRGGRGIDTAIRTVDREGLNVLATQTGGRAIFNENDLGEELKEIAEEMATYYSLAYEPRHGGDEREHRIEVKLKDDGGLRVRHRRGYQDKTPDQRMTERLLGALYLGLTNNPLGIRLGAGTVRTGEKDLVVVPLHILVPVESVAFLPEEDDEVVAYLSIQLQTTHTQKHRGVFEQESFRVARPAGEGSELVDLGIQIALPEGVHLVAVGLRDDTTREMSFVSTTLEIHAEVDSEVDGATR